jgi:uncharacterized protein (DUF427 family)
MKAVWNGIVIAESDDTIKVEGNQYFPADSIQQEYFKPSDTHTVCPWKGKASYYTLEVDGQTNPGCSLVLSFEPRKLRKPSKDGSPFGKA